MREAILMMRLAVVSASAAANRRATIGAILEELVAKHL
jgi:hypothetical protein